MLEILSKALLNTVIGMGTVILVLVLISLIIYCFRFIPDLQAKFTKKPAAPKPATAPKPVAAPAVTVEPEVEEEDDLALIAVITAAIAMQTGTAPDGFVVRSIRRSSRKN